MQVIHPAPHPTNLLRFDETSLVLSLVATHARDNLVVTALALSPRPFCLRVGAEEDGNNDTLTHIPLVAVSDRTTSTVAVLACSRLHRGATKAPIANAATDNGHWRGGGVEEGSGDTMREGGDSANGAGSTSGSPGSVVDQLRLLTVWPCNNVTSLVAASGAPLSSEPDDDGHEHDGHGQEQQQQQHHQHQHHQQQEQYRQEQHHHQHTDRTSRLSGGSGRIGGDMFLLGTASGAVYTFGVDAPSCASQVK